MNYFTISVAENINTKYVGSGKLKSVLNSQKMINFSNQEFPFYEFPNGVDLLLLVKIMTLVTWCLILQWYLLRLILLI